MRAQACNCPPGFYLQPARPGDPQIMGQTCAPAHAVPVCVSRPALHGPFHGLGYAMEVDIPGLGKQSIDIPLEKAAQDAGKIAGEAAVATAWPLLQQKLYAELPKVVQKALDEAEPRIRKETDRAIEAASSRAALIGTGLALVMIGTAFWLRRGMKKKAAG